MNKEASMTFRVEEDLRDKFSAAAKLEYRPAAQVLRDFMRNYVEQVRKRTAGADYISSSERMRREKAVNAARASIGLEGFKVSKEDEEQAHRFINGEIDLSDFLKVSHDHE